MISLYNGRFQRHSGLHNANKPINRCFNLHIWQLTASRPLSFKKPHFFAILIKKNLKKSFLRKWTLRKINLKAKLESSVSWMKSWLGFLVDLSNWIGDRARHLVFDVIHKWQHWEAGSVWESLVRDFVSCFISYFFKLDSISHYENVHQGIVSLFLFSVWCASFDLDSFPTLPPYQALLWKIENLWKLLMFCVFIISCEFKLLSDSNCKNFSVFSIC